MQSLCLDTALRRVGIDRAATPPATLAQLVKCRYRAAQLLVHRHPAGNQGYPKESMPWFRSAFDNVASEIRRVGLVMDARSRVSLQHRVKAGLLAKARPAPQNRLPRQPRGSPGPQPNQPVKH